MRRRTQRLGVVRITTAILFVFAEHGVSTEMAENEALKLIVIYSTLPGGAGGVAAFLMAIRKGHYRNGRYISKLIVEVLGSALTASFLTLMISATAYRIAIAFSIGVAWVSILQMLRNKVTGIVETVLTEEIKRKGD